MKFYEVGGCVRDAQMGRPSKDIDFAVEAGSFQELVDFLVTEGFKIHQIRPEFTTVRAGVPNSHPLRERARDADFVLCRKDGSYSDGRRPDSVIPGTLFEDLSRRDFTMNAMAIDEDGKLHDPYEGQLDLEQGVLRFVGDPMTRIFEDGLRVVRGLRFMVTLDLTPEYWTWAAMVSPAASVAVDRVSKERIADEMDRMLANGTLRTIKLFNTLPEHLMWALFPEGLRLTTTMKEH